MKVGGCAIHRGLPSPAWGWVKDRETIHLGGTKIASSKVDRLNCFIRRVGWRIDLENLVHGVDMPNMERISAHQRREAVILLPV